jgi:hypothetical protein
VVEDGAADEACGAGEEDAEGGFPCSERHVGVGYNGYIGVKVDFTGRSSFCMHSQCDRR